jgi:hypothetical protein
MSKRKKNAHKQFWTVKAIAKRNRVKAESRLPESYPLPPPPVAKRRGIITRLREGESCAVVGWQAAPAEPPKWLAKMMARNSKKAKNRERYERQFKRRTPHS